MKARHLLWILMLCAAAAPAGCTPEAPAAGGSLTVDHRIQPWRSSESGGLELTTEHYRIYTTVTRADMLRCLPGFMEAAYLNYLDLTGLPAGGEGRRMPVYMMASRNEWASLTQRITGPNADLYLSIQAGGYCHQGVGVFWNMGGLGTLSVAAHEGLHQFFHHRLRDRLPMWLEEGLCTVAEGYNIQPHTVTFTHNRNVIRGDNLREAVVQARSIPLARLLEMDSGDAVVKGAEYALGYYGQLWAMALYIRSAPQYRAGMERLIRDAHAGRLHAALNVPAAALARLARRGRAYNRSVSRPLFEHYITEDLATFDAAFRDFARELAGLR